MSNTSTFERFNNPAAVISDIARYYRILLDRELQPLGLTRSQWWLLANLYHNDGINQKDLALVLDIGKSATGKLVYKLEEKGWIERRPDESDGRAYNVFLTSRIKPVVDKISDIGMQIVDQTLVDFSEQEIKKFMGLLTRLNNKLTDLEDGVSVVARFTALDLAKEVSGLSR